MFAKYAFGADNIPVPYSDLRFRNGWFWNNLFGMVGAKYFAIALMDGIIVYWLYKRLQLMIKEVDERNGRTSRYGVGCIGDDIYILVYGNFLRFNGHSYRHRCLDTYAYVVGVIALAILFIK
jgi:hypothetical protein